MIAVKGDYLKKEEEEIVGEKRKQVKETGSRPASERFSSALAARQKQRRPGGPLSIFYTQADKRLVLLLLLGGAGLGVESWGAG